MCGITGIAYWKSEQPFQDILKRMNASIAHRGPDAEGFYFDENIALGHRRLSIIDTSDAGNQPFFNSDQNIVVVFNGEIYNYIELKAQLRDEYTFTTNSDTEVIIAAYIKWGLKCVEHFNGMFAFALYDKLKNECYIFRDRLGEKPVYFYQENGGVAFSSEIRSLMKSGFFKPKISKTSFEEFLKFQTVYSSDTILEGVKMIPPGSFLRVSKSHWEICKYWDLSMIHLDKKNNNRDEVLAKIRCVLESSVEMRMRSDVPFGAFLSGGIDSSIIVGLMAKKSKVPVRSFSITFHEKEFDEGKYSRLIAEKYNTNHTEIKLSASDFLNLIPDALKAMDHPSGDGPNTYVVAKVTKEKGVTMTLSGLGGDEIFAGYDVFKRLFYLNEKKWLNKTPQALRSVVGSSLQVLKPSVASDKIAELLKSDAIDLNIAYRLSRQVWMQKSINSLIKGNKEKNKELPLASLEAEHNGTLSYVSKREMSSYMMDVLLRDSDQMSMAHALEVRVPFIDHRLVELLLTINDDIKFPHTPKQLLVDACSDVIPREIVDRPKMGFTFPWAIWLKNELKPFAWEGIQEVMKLDFIDDVQLENFWNEFLKGSSTVTWSRIWPIVVLGHWMKQNEIN